ncbi:MAG TPA: UvrD-helicase domain-containing protein, partial [Planctomycetota bacterium]|nr:UvrD-helicase domain-containing protein [Planctomycetota bacterium]
MSRALSPAQAAALDLGESLVLSAGAGSGKTRVLVARYVAALEDVGGDLDRVAAVTFTEKAAGELRERVRRALLDAAAQADAEGRADDAAWRRDVEARLGEAWIGTIHAFCRR